MKRVILSAARFVGTTRSARPWTSSVLHSAPNRLFGSNNKHFFSTTAKTSQLSSPKESESRSEQYDAKQGDSSAKNNNPTSRISSIVKMPEENVRVPINSKQAKQEGVVLDTESIHASSLKTQTSAGHRHEGLAMLPASTSSPALELNHADNVKGAGGELINLPNEPMSGSGDSWNKEPVKPAGRVGRRVRKRASEERQMELIRIVESIQVENKECLSYPLHSFEEIPDSFVNSYKAHQKLIICRATYEEYAMLKTFADIEDKMASEVPGKIFYFRVEVDGAPSKTSNDDSLDSRAKALRDEALGKLRHLLEDFCHKLLEIREGEVLCDLTHYTVIAPLLACSKRNLAQMMRDTDCLVKGLPFDKEGIAGDTPPELLEPVTLEEAAKEIAARIKSEVIEPLQRTHSHARESGASSGGAASVFVFVGIATTPALAKIACDAEVTKWRRQRESLPKPVAQLCDLNASEMPGAGGTSEAAVRVRSLYPHFETMESGKKFMANFSIAHIPTFTPAFVRFLRAVFGVETCSDLYDKRTQMHFSLTKETFKACYTAAFGRMRFPEEDKVVLFSPTNMFGFSFMLSATANNSISILDRSRTQLRRVMLNTMAYQDNRRPDSYTLRVARHRAIDGRLCYGRLFREDEFIDAVLRATSKAYEMVRKRGVRTGGLRINLRRGRDVTNTVFARFPETNDYDTLIKIAYRLAVEIAPFRQQKGPDNLSEAYAIQIMFNCFELENMIPQRFVADIETLKEDLFCCVRKLRKFGYWRIGQRAKEPCKTNPLTVAPHKPKKNETKALADSSANARISKTIVEI